jgi:hypothetical protein
LLVLALSNQSFLNFIWFCFAFAFGLTSGTTEEEEEGQKENLGRKVFYFAVSLLEEKFRNRTCA